MKTFAISTMCFPMLRMHSVAAQFTVEIEARLRWMRDRLAAENTEDSRERSKTTAYEQLPARTTGY